MSTVPFIVRKRSTKRLVRTGLCQAEMVDAQIQTTGEEGILVSVEEMNEAKAQLRQDFDAAMQAAQEIRDQEG